MLKKMNLMKNCILIICIICCCYISAVKGLKLRTISLSELTVITKEGKQLWETLGEKTKLPQYGSCWKRAVHDLQIGCKFLSEEVQSDLALRFTDCFLQTSGFEPLACMTSKVVCLRNLSDRAFNAYTEFFTHTQSICYFLQSQIWHEEAQKTIEKLSDMSVVVSEQLEKTGNIQKQILKQQKESLILQHYLLDNGKTIASVLELSEEKISKIMTDLQNSALEQRKVLLELFEKLNLLRSGVLGEMTWINSVLFYMASMIVGFLFTSISSTKRARIYILIFLTISYFTERFICSYISDSFDEYSREKLTSWVWLSRKLFIFVSIIILIYSALVYCDYNIVNHKLLNDIKNQNKKIIKFFESDPMHFCKSIRENDDSNISVPQSHNNGCDYFYSTTKEGRGNTSKNFNIFPVSSSDNYRKNYTKMFNKTILPSTDDIDNITVMSVKPETSKMSSRREAHYNLRSSKNKN